jgi:Stigma-specific protein, Stig1
MHRPAIYTILAALLGAGACAKGSLPLAGEDDDAGAQGGGFGAGGSGAGASGVGGDATPCPDGLAACSGSCVSLTESPVHCGGCNAACAMGEQCIGGSCVAASMATSSSSVAASSGAASSSAAATVAASSSSGGGSGCHPLNPAAGCGAGSHCVPQTSGVAQCLSPTGFGAQYGSCLGPTDCAAIYDCVTTPYATSYCMQWCSGDFDCPGYPSDSCVGLDPPLFAQGLQWGVCYDGFP